MIEKSVRLELIFSFKLFNLILRIGNNQKTNKANSI